jgi:8-oxo-dGTP pyrophosphatase MutT (NUDIX family)
LGYCCSGSATLWFKKPKTRDIKDEMADVSLYTSSRLAVVDRDGYIFTHTTNAVVYLLPFRRPVEGACFLGRLEVCPAHGPERRLYAITGQCAPGEDPLAVARQELHEEAGIEAEAGRFHSLGTAYLSKQADTRAHLFTVDVTGLAQGTAATDGSVFEQGSSCEWVTRDEALNAPCVGLAALIARGGM